MYRILCLIGLFVFLTTRLTAAAPPEYTVIDLGPGSVLISVDPHGVGVGSWQGRAALFSLDGSHVLIDTLPGGDGTSIATDRDGVHGTVGEASVNAPGQVEATHAFYRA